ncbi:hypothetical protein LAJ19_09790 [Deinococcus taeanensis]|uniref:hypothetical protein n=1 Tax=Deinococcus taeanensis TaxID=2737050 RepID=UPI001CDBDD5E|nr:hypothetical protein [Deinococcus taeanensis]UBV41931.1 hypothetical protein LAJ19_09790 [Deinococcus taeanensis]
MHRWGLTAAFMILSGAGAQAAGSCGGAPGLPDWARAGTYRGTLGTLAVALTLDPRGESRYFYERRSLDLTLEARRAGNQLVLQETTRRSLDEGVVVTGCFTLMPDGAALKGTWQAPGGAAPLEVRLTALNAAALPLNLPVSAGLVALRRDDPLTFLKLNRAWVRFPDGRSVREPLSGVQYPRLPGAPAALNAALQDRQLTHAADALACHALLPESLRSGGDGYHLKATVTLDSARLLSVREDAEYYCGGPYPDHFTTGVILDRLSGRAVPLGALWPRLSAARQRNLYLSAVRNHLTAECRTVAQDGASSFTAHLSAAGLNLTPTGYPHVVAACAETAVIPYARLRADANLNSPLVKTLYAK